MKYNLLLATIILSAFIPLSTYAADFIGLVGIPGLTNNAGDLNAYINALYRLSISIAALLAVIKIVAAGAKYMLSDIVTHKEDAKKDIQGALIGLLIVIGAIIILNTVNSDLTNLNFTVPVQEITQGQALERAIYDAVTADCDRPGRAAACQTLVCEGWITHGMEVRDGEDEISACRRTCFEDYGGAFDPKLYSPKSSTCRYDPVTAQKCDINNSWNCCKDINNGTWYPGHNMCYTDTNPFRQINCDTKATGQQNGRATFESDCTAQIASCTADGNNTVVSTRGGSILCTDKEQAAENAEEATELQVEISDCRSGGQYWFSEYSYCGRTPIQNDVNYNAVFKNTAGEDVTIKPYSTNNLTGLVDQVIATTNDGETELLNCNQILPSICETQ
jgi:hypothetical protein